MELGNDTHRGRRLPDGFVSRFLHKHTEAEARRAAKYASWFFYQAVETRHKTTPDAVVEEARQKAKACRKHSAAKMAQSQNEAFKNEVESRLLFVIGTWPGDCRTMALMALGLGLEEL
jgi:hypothetical protein